MRLLIEPSLMERVVYETARSDELLAPAYQREFAACFAEPDGDRRDRAFESLHERWFNQLGYRGRITARLAEFPFIRECAARIAVDAVSDRRRQGVELFGQPGNYAIALGVPPTLLRDGGAFDLWARHELQHADDMLDPLFAYDRSLRPHGPTTAAENLVRDRYAVLWAISVDARWSDRTAGPLDCKPKRRQEFFRAFGCCDGAAGALAFDHLWERLSRERPTHATLLAWSEHGPPGLSVSSADRPAAAQRLMRGAPCPLCKFSTFDWFDAPEGDPDLLAAVRADFPTWTPAAGLCGQCAALYHARIPASGLSVP